MLANTRSTRTHIHKSHNISYKEKHGLLTIYNRPKYKYITTHIYKRIPKINNMKNPNSTS